ncbi:MAG TPA: YggT family protein [Gemmatimonadaceae bacterium]|jgi:YggT family protein|nr:YggT family protein [Gemmatimonadaceae bacterium]
MNGVVVAFDQGLIVLRYAFLGMGVIAAAICGVDWLARTRRLNPFGAVARFCRASVDPLLAPVERAVVRAGGLPSSAPWWGLVTVVIGGIVVITLVNALRTLLFSALFAASNGPRDIARLLVAWTFEFLQVALLVRVLSSWVRVSPYSAWVRWAYAATEWLLRPLRQILPTMGPFDLSPIVAYFILMLLERAVVGLF